MGFVKLSWLSLWFWGHLECLWEDYALLTGSMGADGAQEQCWNGWVSSGMDKCERLGKAVVGIFSQNCPKCLLFPNSLTAEFQRHIFFLLSDVS